MLADRHGHGVHLLERDCSTSAGTRRCSRGLPRRSPRERAEITGVRSPSATEAGYENAARRLLLDTASGEADFLETNTRLQAEDPVAELPASINGGGSTPSSDRVAAGEALAVYQGRPAA